MAFGNDSIALESYISEELDVVVSDTAVLHDGLNLSVAVSTEEASPAFVVRKPNKFRQQATFNDIAQEYRVMEHLQRTEIPVPTPVSICTDASVVGDPFLVMTYVDGEAIPLGTDLPEPFRTPRARAEIGTRLIDTLAALHSVDTDPFEGTCDRRLLRDHVARIVEQFEDATSGAQREYASLGRVADWLGEHVPSDSRTALVHGDYRPANVLFAGAERPAITGVLDWETAFLGDSLVELGYLLLRWRDEGDPTPSLDSLSERYADEEVIQELRGINERGLVPFTSDPGSPTRRELVERYEDKTGLTFENDRFYRAFAAFILATIWVELHRHQRQAGGESSREPYIDYMSMIATSIVDGEFPL